MFVKLSKRFFLIPSPQFGDRFRNGLNHNLFDWECDSALFYSGRCALLAGVKLLASVSPEKNEILVPAYICEGALFALRDAGFSFKYYSADDQFNFDRTEMESKINKNTVAILIVHYFGIPQRLETIRTLCNDRNIFLIEDCAHAFGSREVDIPLGSVGDISIFSFKKFLPIGDGGALVVNNKKVRKEFKKIHTVTTSTTKGCPNITVKSLLNTLEYKYGVSIRKNRLRHDMSIEELCPRTDLTRERECFTESEPISDYSK
ncbi:MAG: aminotransferase class I/II-fold pyridoxal phosphate-dependent enzyme, partial [Candidatus Omnitrophica bacterium]|nr:aminotransferase class I/II-fold pyridoxal phosphate-dependent enzyme [Candidatus Omnitrophota bacterium]